MSNPKEASVQPLVEGTLGHEIERAYADAISWHLETTPATGDIETRLTAGVRKVTLEVQLHPGRLGSVFVSVHRRRRREPQVWPAPVACTIHSAFKKAMLG